MLGGVWAFRLSCLGIPLEDVWKPAIGEKLHAEQEPDNTVDKFAMKVVKNNERFLVCWCLVVRVKRKLIA